MIKHHKDRVFRLLKFSDFARNITTMVTGTALAQMITFAVSPLITRLYSPEEQGVFAIYLATVMLVGPIACGTYDQAIVLPEKEQDARNLLTLSLLILVFVSLVSFILISINYYFDFIKDLNKIPWYLIPIHIFVFGLYQVFQSWQTRRKNFFQISKSKISQSLSTSMVNIIAGFLKFSSSGLVFGTFIGQVVSVFVMIINLKETKSGDWFRLSKDRIFQLAKRYSAFPKFNLLQVLSDGARDSIIIFIISSLFTKDLLGLYFFSLKILRTPLSIIGASVAMVMYQKAASNINLNQPIQYLIRKISTRLALIAIPPYIVILMFGPKIFNFVFGKSWEIAGVFSQILVPWLLIGLFASSLSQIPLVLNRQKTFLQIGLGYNVILIVSILIPAFLLKDLIITLVCLSATGSLYLIGVTVWIIKISKSIGGNYGIQQ